MDISRFLVNYYYRCNFSQIIQQYFLLQFFTIVKSILSYDREEWGECERKRKKKKINPYRSSSIYIFQMLDELAWVTYISYRPNQEKSTHFTTAFQSIWSTHILPKDPRFPNISIKADTRQSHIRLRVITSSVSKFRGISGSWSKLRSPLCVKKEDEK